MIFGPNTATGHSSVILASENMVNFALQFVKIIINGDATCFDVKREAEEAYTADIQKSLKNTVWHSGGCQSWYFDRSECISSMTRSHFGVLWLLTSDACAETGWNSTLYPHSQLHFTWRCMFPTWSDWNIKYTRKGIIKRGVVQVVRVVALLAAITGAYQYRAGRLRGASLASVGNVLRDIVGQLRGLVVGR